MNVPSLIKDPPNHRHILAQPHLIPGMTSILDVGGLSYKKKAGQWIRHIGAPKEVWGVSHVLDIHTHKPSIFTINVTRDYDRHDRKPDKYYDGLHVPFADSSYDIVTSIDVLEHIASTERNQVISEMIRVAKHRVIIVFPFFSPDNVKMEEDILLDMKKKRIQPKPSFIEHRAYELPKIRDIEKFLKKKKVNYNLTFGTPRSLMKKYYMFQNSINALLHIPGTSKEQLVDLLTIIMNAAGRVFNLQKQVGKIDAYRAIISITK